MALESVGPTEHKGAGEEKGKGSSNNKRASAAALIDAFAQQYQADRQETGRREKHRIFREWLTIVGLFIAAVVAFFQWRELRSTDHNIAEQAKIAGGQLQAMKDQLVEMKSTGTQTDTLIETNRSLANAAAEQAAAATIIAQTAQDSLSASQRAWVGPSGAKIEDAIEAGKEVKAVITVINSGREPAKNLFWDVVGIPTDTIEDNNGIPAFIIRKYIESCFNTRSQYRHQVIFPSTGLGGGFTFTSQIAADKIDQGVVDGTKTLVVQGCLAYDAFGKTHHTAFCFFYKAGFTKPDNLNICTGGTDAD